MPVIFNSVVLSLGRFKLGPIDFVSAVEGLHIIQGSNGSGKTSLLKSMIKRVPLTSGSIDGLQFPLGSVGMEPLMMGSWTVSENIEFFSQLLQRDPDANHLNRVQKFHSRRFDSLSLGQRRQVELSFSFSMNFSILLLDEPLSPLDQEQRTIYSEILNSEAKKRIIFVTSHQENEYSSPAKVLKI